jgi:L-amino acid N-acyltransferase YncA
MKYAIRMAQPGDAPALLAIYTPYVLNTAITFEYDPPAQEEFLGRMKNTLARYPYLVAVGDGVPLGYAYAAPFKNRAAYDWSVETTIYLAPQARGMGLGRALYLALEDCLRRQHVINLYACIAVTGRKGVPYLTDASPRFHAKMGYRENARFTACGYKFGRWYDMIWMEKQLGEHGDKPEPFLPFENGLCFPVSGQFFGD